MAHRLAGLEAHKDKKRKVEITVRTVPQRLNRKYIRDSRNRGKPGVHDTDPNFRICSAAPGSKLAQDVGDFFFTNGEWIVGDPIDGVTGKGGLAWLARQEGVLKDYEVIAKGRRR